MPVHQRLRQIFELQEQDGSSYNQSHGTESRGLARATSRRCDGLTRAGRWCAVSCARRNHHEVGAGDSRGVGSVNHNALIAKECRRRRIGAQECIRVLHDEIGGGNVAVFARKVANLAGLWGRDVARVVFTAVGRVQMTHGRGTVAVGRDGELVDMVDERTVLGFGGEAGEVDRD